MTVRLVVRQRGEAGGNDKPSELLLDDALITFGRDSSCQVVLPQRAVSRAHARITRDGALSFLEDLGSAYGTQVNGKELPKGEKRLLRNGDTIVIAQFDISFERKQDLPSGQAGKSERTAFVARQAVKDAMRGLTGSTEEPSFRVMSGVREGDRIELPEAQELIVGRDETADLTLKDDLVSRRHAKIRRDWSGTHVEDLGSRNGIRVNRKRVSRRTLKDKDELEIGSTRLLFLDPNAVHEESLAPPEPSDAEPLEDTNPHQDLEEPLPNPVVSDPPAEPAEAAPEPPPEEPEVPPADVDEEPPPDEDEPPFDDEEPLEEDPEPEAVAAPPGPLAAFLQNQRKLIVLGVIGFFALAVLGLVIAVLAGL